MKLCRFITLFSGILSFCYCNAQVFYLDAQQSLYTLHQDELVKADKISGETFTFKDNNLGRLTAYDASNPMRVITYYEDVQSLVILDNTLHAKANNIIDLNFIGLYQLPVFSSSKMYNGIWFYDQESFSIKFLDFQSEIDANTGNLKLILNKDSLNPTDLYESKGFLFIENYTTEIIVLDIYGTYYKTINLPDYDFWNPVNSAIFYSAGGKVFYIDMKTTEHIELFPEKIIPADAQILRIDNSTIYWLDNNTVKKCGLSI